MRLLLIAAAATAASWAFAPPEASAATVGIAGVETRVEVTADIAGLGLTATPFGSAGVDGTGAFPVFVFPITGGTLDTGTSDAVIFHNGSGLTLSNGSVSATVGNFVIDTANTTVSGDVIDASNGTITLAGVPLFSFGTVSPTRGVELLISTALGGTLASVFIAPDLSGAQFGFAVPEVAAVPLPASALLLLGGLGLLGGLRARARRAA